MDASLTALTKSINGLGAAFEAFKETNDERVSALEKGDTSKAGELGVKLAKIEEDVGSFSKLKKDIEVEVQLHKERIEELDLAGTSPAAPGRPTSCARSTRPPSTTGSAPRVRMPLWKRSSGLSRPRLSR